MGTRVVEPLLAVCLGLHRFVALDRRPVAAERPQPEQVAVVGSGTVGAREDRVGVGRDEDRLVEVSGVANRPRRHHQHEAGEHQRERRDRARAPRQRQEQQRHEQHRLTSRQRRQPDRQPQQAGVAQRPRPDETQRQPQRGRHQRGVQRLRQQRTVGHPQERVHGGDRCSDQADPLPERLATGQSAEQNRRRPDEARHELLARGAVHAELPEAREHQREERRMLGARIRAHVIETDLRMRHLDPAEPVGDRPRPLVIRDRVAVQLDLAREQAHVEQPDDQSGEHGQSQPRPEAPREAHGARVGSRSL